MGDQPPIPGLLPTEFTHAPELRTTLENEMDELVTHVIFNGERTQTSIQPEMGEQITVSYSLDVNLDLGDGIQTKTTITVVIDKEDDVAVKANFAHIDIKAEHAANIGSTSSPVSSVMNIISVGRLIINRKLETPDHESSDTLLVNFSNHAATAFVSSLSSESTERESGYSYAYYGHQGVPNTTEEIEGALTRAIQLTRDANNLVARSAEIKAN